MHGHTVVGEQGVQESAENAPLWGPSGVAILFLTLAAWGRPVRKSRTQLHRAGSRPNVSSLVASLEGTMVLNVELLLIIYPVAYSFYPFQYAHRLGTGTPWI